MLTAWGGGLPNITDNRQHSLGRDTHTPALNAGALRRSRRPCEQEDIMGMKHWLAGVAVAAFAAVGAYVYLDTGRTAAPESTFVLLDGSSQTTADLRGKVTLVNFWPPAAPPAWQRCRNHRNPPEVQQPRV